ncbi:MAG: nucleotide exchange factor GrpE [Planctomycetaceae bacterium]|nr:nucleotide exchange factor GrpE [Planctomycetaceae bacterium]
MTEPFEDNVPDDGGADAKQSQAAGDSASSELDRLKSELAEAQDRVLRSQAEMENFRRRTRRDVEDERRFATKSLLSDLLPVLDNIQRAIEAGKQAGDGAGLLQGFEMVYQQLLEVLNQHHCPQLGTVGDPFDPALHEAIAEEPSEDLPKGVVTRVHLSGYKLHDRLIRAAQVVVSSGPPTS